MNNQFELGTPLNIQWHFKRPDGENYSLEGQQPTLYCINARGRFMVPSVVMNAEGGYLSFTLDQRMQVCSGEYSFLLQLRQNGVRANDIIYRDAVTLVRSGSAMSIQEAANNNVPPTIQLFTVGEFNLYTPTAPVGGADGYWYFNGQRILDEHDNDIAAYYSVKFTEEGENKGRITIYKGAIEQGVVVATFDAIKEALVTAANDHTRAENDHTQAANDHTRAESDHNTAANDHTQSGTDHTRAESDHSTAANDHTRAENDHTQAANDHTRAESDHTQAANDHTQSGTDHTRAESDHSTAANDHTRAENDHSTATNDHTRAGNDHITAATDHNQAGNDHTQAVEDHLITQGFNSRVVALENEVFPLEAALFIEDNVTLFEYTGTAVSKDVSWAVKRQGEVTTIDSMTLKQDSETIKSGSSASGTETVSLNKLGVTAFVLNASKNMLSVSKTLNVEMVRKMYFGFADDDLADPTTLTAQTLKSSPAGTYTMSNGTAGKYLWLCVGSNKTINGVTSAGFEVPMEAAETIGNYKCYRSSEALAAGSITFTII